ncbi:F-box/LRR-repeat protein [Quillaja saponaria]|uniref:F-box/LRR-repeat protein n=1 Tax=Quillaja saponaria TaxID=32244 RepID=A0AAD7KVI1_QUISA|nr:F-box/LRR-repeat protein [Quillaja saponaria]
MASRTGQGFHSVTDDIVHNILGRLQAVSFASAACVSKYWNRICSQILSHPKLASALSLNPNLTLAAGEVLDKVLSKPIRPHFAIACTGDILGLKIVDHLIRERVGRRTPVITHASSGVIGRDVPNKEVREVKWGSSAYDGPHPVERNIYGNINPGIVLVVGFVPGLKVDADTFTTEKKDHALPKETAIVGDGGGCFLFRSQNYPISYSSPSYSFDAVALVFARDKNKSQDIGETQFHVLMSAGLMPFGPQLEVVSIKVEEDEQSWLSARMEGDNAILDGQAILEDINEVVDNSSELYIGVTQQRQYSNGSEKMTMALYEVMEGENEYFVVDGVGIEPGDSFLFYHPDLETASTTRDIALENLEVLKADIISRNNFCLSEADNDEPKGVFGGLIFSCHSRGKSFFEEDNVDSSPFYLNFPGVPLAGAFCHGEIGRGSSSSIEEVEGQEQCPPHCCLHACSSVYLVLAYIPAAPSQE